MKTISILFHYFVNEYQIIDDSRMQECLIRVSTAAAFQLPVILKWEPRSNQLNIVLISRLLAWRHADRASLNHYLHQRIDLPLTQPVTLLCLSTFSRVVHFVLFLNNTRKPVLFSFRTVWFNYHKLITVCLVVCIRQRSCGPVCYYYLPITTVIQQW